MTMDKKFESPYDPQSTEKRIYKQWEDSGLFNPDTCIEKGICESTAESFSMVQPPPNVTGTLHMGHAFEGTIQDTVIRFQRMRGRKTLWVPGTDHAAIATESKLLKILYKEEGKRRGDLTRSEFMERITKFAQESHDTIVNQVRRLGASLDWSREAYTLDTDREKAVFTAFKQMYDDGLIYRGHRSVNWDPKGQTVISDDEVVRKETSGRFYYLKYGPFTIGTARPETKFGDKYVVVHPEDERYAQYKHLEQFELEWINGPITATLIKDEASDPEVGTGVMTITPWHSQIDFEIAERHDLDKEQIIDQYGKLLPIAGEFKGMKIDQARERIVDKLQKKGLVERIDEHHVHQLATAERTGATIEPQIMEQWFVDVNKPFPMRASNIPGIKTGQEVTLKRLMLHVVKNGHVKILPERFEKIYFNWVDNLRDWNISRQLWFGHRIPVWYWGDKIAISEEKPSDDPWIQDEDTLDTWFSSALWTFSTLGWPEKTDDLKTYHPTQLVDPGYEILFFWVARMILMSTYLLGEIPFETAYMHGMVRDKSGKKYSKSSMTANLDPLEIIDIYGADAMRMALMVGVGPGADSRFDQQKVKGYKHFANKLWNITRFVLTNTQDYTFDKNTPLDANNKKHIDELNKVVADVTQDMEAYNMYLAAEKLYHYVWHTFADVILEESKAALKGDDPKARIATQHTLLEILATSLQLLHPFMPFITEEIWQSLPKQIKDQELLMVSRWPQAQ